MKENEKIENVVETEKKNDAKDVCSIKVIDSEGYDIEQFLCRCGNKTASLPY